MQSHQFIFRPIAASLLLLPTAVCTIVKPSLNNLLTDGLWVIKRRRIISISKIQVCILVFAFLLPIFLAPNLAAAETIDYNNDISKLNPDPLNTANSSLYSTTHITNNIITVNSGTIPGSVYGGVSVTGATVSDNAVTINGGTINYNAHGGYSGINTVAADHDNSSASGVTANGRSTASLDNATASANADKVYLNGGTVGNSLSGGYVSLSAQGGTSKSGTASGDLTTQANASAFSNANSNNVVTTADSNIIAISSGLTVSGDISGGYISVNLQGGVSTGGNANSSPNNDTNLPARANGNANANAESSTFSASGNSITVKTGITVSAGQLYGGYAAINGRGGSATGGTTNNGTAIATSYAHAYSNANADNAKVTANSNTIAISNHTSLSANVFGGYAVINLEGGTTTAGTSTTRSATHTANANGQSNADANLATITANNNSVNIGDGSNLSGNLSGGYALLDARGGTAEGGDATSPSNRFDTSATAFGRVFVDNATVTASDNTISLGTGVTVSGDVSGGHAAMNLQGGTATGGTSHSDSTDNAATAVSTAYTDVSTDAATVTAENNKITLGSGATVSGSVSGGHASLSAHGGVAQGGTATSTSPKEAQANAFTTATASNATVYANNNTIVLEVGTTVSGDVSGGYAALNLQGGTGTGGAAAEAEVYIETTASGSSLTANNNNVTLNGKLGNGDIYGGYVLFAIAGPVDDISASSATATNNTVTIGEKTVTNAANSIYGGYLGYNTGDMPDSYNVFSGNRLNVSGKHTVEDIYNFEYLSFMLPDGFTVNDSLVIASSVNLDQYNTSYTGTTVTEINSIGVLTAGNTYKLITGSNGFSGIIANDEASGVYDTGFISGTYEWVDVGVNNNILTATLKSLTTPAVNPGTGATGDGLAASMAFLWQAADLRSRIFFVPRGPRWIPFAKMVYGKQYISTGSSVTVKGFSALAGLAHNTNFDNGHQLIVGLFAEGGWGDYDGRHSYSNSVRIKGTGDTEYYGGGILGRYATAGGLYGEGTFSVGKTKSDFRSRDFVSGSVAKYNYAAPYYSAHLAVGQILKLNDSLDLEIYGKYLWTRQEGDSFTILNDRFRFKAADSHRLQAGSKLKVEVSPQLQPYAGAAYEYEFSGKVKGSLYGLSFRDASLRGGTAIGELGLVWTPDDTKNLRVDLGVQGYVGKREGVSGSLTVVLNF